ncbi:Major facilitator super [Chamberlinius hualienensis]
MTSIKTVVRLLCLVGFLDLLGVSMLLPLIPKQVLTLGANSVVAGIIGSLYGGVQLFSSPVIGSWSDLKGQKFVLICSLITSGLSYLLLGSSTVLYVLIFSRVLSGTLKHSQTLLTSCMAGVVPSSDRSTYYGYFNGISNIGFIIGPTLGGHIAESSNGFFLVSCLVTLLFLTNAFIIWIFLPDDSHKKAIKKSDRAAKNVTNLSSNYFREFGTNIKDCWDIMAFRLILGFSTLIYRSNFSLVLEQKYDYSPKYVGYLISFQGIISTIAGLVVGHLTSLDTNTDRQTLYGVFALTFALFGVTVSHSIYILIISLLILSISTSFLRVCLSTVLAERCQKDKLGAVLGLGQSVTSVARMLAPVAGGVALQMGSYGPGLVGSITSTIGLALSVYLCVSPVSKSTKQD